MAAMKVKTSPQLAEPPEELPADNEAALGNPYDGFVGHVDRCEGQALEGWSQVPFLPHLAAIVEISIDGKVAGLARANMFREDLRHACIRDGFAAFRFAVPDEYCDGRLHELEVRERLSQKVLGGAKEFCLELRRGPLRRSEIFLGGTTLANFTDTAAFVETLVYRRRLAILTTFSPDNLLYGCHHKLIDALQSAGFAVLLGQARASGAFVEQNSLAPLPSRADACLIRENLGYDFGTWFACFAAVREHVHLVDELLLINDSVFGPLFDMEEFCGNLAGRSEDVVGLCDSYEYNYHLQSFFLLFKKNVLMSGVLEKFCETYPYSDNKADVIRDGELALTPALMSAGFSCSALYPYERLSKAWLANLPGYFSALRALPENVHAGHDSKNCNEIEYLINLARHIRRGDPVNPSHAFWDILLEMRCPFVKRELLFKNPSGHPLVYRAGDAIAATGYSLELIRESARQFGTSKVYF